jgi:hypothetical protein
METIPTVSFGNYRMGLEGTLEEGENITEAFKQAKQKIAEAFREINPQLTDDAKTVWGAPPIINYFPSPAPIQSVDYKAKERLEILIDNATTWEELIQYQEQANELGIINHYKQRAKQFSSDHFQST